MGTATLGALGEIYTTVVVRERTRGGQPVQPESFCHEGSWTLGHYARSCVTCTYKTNHIMLVVVSPAPIKLIILCSSSLSPALITLVRSYSSWSHLHLQHCFDHVHRRVVHSYKKTIYPLQTIILSVGAGDKDDEHDTV